MKAPAAATRIWDFLCRYRLWLAGGLAVVATLDVAWVAVTYLIYPGYLDHGEPSVALISWRLLDGIPAYPVFDHPGRIANIYGPLTYLTHAAAFAMLGPSLVAGKAAAAAVLLIPVAVFLGQRRRGVEAALIGAVVAVALVGLVAALILASAPAAWVLFLLFLWGSLLFALGCIGIYVGRTYKDVRGRPRYIIKDRIGFDD